MMHVLSEEEVEESNRRIEKWWEDLNRNLKLLLYNTNKTHFEQIYCVHEFKTMTGSRFHYCNKCNLAMEK